MYGTQCTNMYVQDYIQVYSLPVYHPQISGTLLAKRDLTAYTYFHQAHACVLVREEGEDKETKRCVYLNYPLSSMDENVPKMLRSMLA